MAGWSNSGRARLPLCFASHWLRSESSVLGFSCREDWPSVAVNCCIFPSLSVDVEGSHVTFADALKGRSGRPIVFLPEVSS